MRVRTGPVTAGAWEVPLTGRDRPRSRSAWMSSTSSRPTATRTIPWTMPAAWRCASVSRPCEVLAGWVMVVLVSPRLAVIERISVESIRWKAFLRAAAGSPAGAATTKETTAPPQPRCCAIASACWGCDASPG